MAEQPGSRLTSPAVYSLGSLLPGPSLLLARLHQETGNWTKTRQEAIACNIITGRAHSTIRFLTGELLNRLKQLSPVELDLFTSLHLHDRLLMLWLAICRRYYLVADLAESFFYNGYQTRFGHADFNRWFHRQVQFHPALEALAISSAKKMRTSVFQTLREARLLEKDFSIRPVYPGHLLKKALLALPREQRMWFPGLSRSHLACKVMA